MSQLILDIVKVNSTLYWPDPRDTLPFYFSFLYLSVVLSLLIIGVYLTLTGTLFLFSGPEAPPTEAAGDFRLQRLLGYAM